MKARPRRPRLLAFVCAAGLSLALSGCLGLPPTPAKTDDAGPLHGLKSVDIRDVESGPLFHPPDGGEPIVGDLIGETRYHQARYEDTLIDLARTYDVGFVEISVANPQIDPWLPGEAARIVLPTAHVLPPGPREGIVINLPEQRLYLYEGDGRASTFPIGVGREGWETPLGKTKVVRKRENPTWFPPASIRHEEPDLAEAVPPGPDNPLGTRALYLGWPSYLIHGTNEPYGVGRRVSRGCIRLYPEDILRLYDRVPVGTPVRVIDEPIKLGWSGQTLYLEVHPTLKEADQIEKAGELEATSRSKSSELGIRERIVVAAGPAADWLDWRAVERALNERKGIPIPITRAPRQPKPRTQVTASR